MGLRKYTTKNRAGFQDPTKKQLHMRKRRERESEREREKIRKDEIIMRVTIILGTEIDPFCKGIQKFKCKREKEEDGEEERWWVCGLGCRV